MAVDLNGNAYQSFFSIFLNNIESLGKIWFFLRILCFLIDSNFISFSLMLNIFNTFKELSGIIGYNIIETFLINSKDTYIIVPTLLISFFFFPGFLVVKILITFKKLILNKISIKVYILIFY